MSGTKVTIRVPAKLNLSLAVTGRRGNMHTLDMIVYPYEELEDVVSLTPTAPIGLSGLRAQGYEGFDKERFEKEGSQKLDAILRRFELGGEVEITKSIPLGAGLGGSSAVYVGLIKAILHIKEEKGESTALDTDFLMSIGSDVPCMMYGRACRVKGVGEEIIPLKDVPRLNFKLLIAQGGADSGACYRLYDEMSASSEKKEPAPSTIDEAVAACRNDLFEASIRVNPAILSAYESLRAEGYKHVVMTGSGSGVIAII